MSRSGRNARRWRLINANNWTPTACLDPLDAHDQARRDQMTANRDNWIKQVGIDGWQHEVARRRKERNLALRQRRLQRVNRIAR
jgi:hypothetical protein